MSEIANARINTFGISPKADFESPAESITVPAVLLHDLLGAIQDLKEEVAQLQATVAGQGAEIAALRTRLATLESLEEQDVTRLACDISQDRRRIASLENPHKEPGKTVASRAEKIEKYLSSRPDHRATFETLKGHLGIDKDRLKEAIKTLMASEPGRYGITRAPGDKRKRTLVMLPK